MTDSSILIVDDQPSNIISLGEILADVGTCYFASSGAEALAIYHRETPDVVLLDIEMDDMDGFEVCRRLHESAGKDGISVIFISAHDTIENQRKSMEIGAQDFLAKPVDPLICKIRVEHQLHLRQRTRELNSTRQELYTLIRQIPVSITFWNKEWKNKYSNHRSAMYFSSDTHNIHDQHLSSIFDQATTEKIIQESRNLAGIVGGIDFQLEIPSQQGVRYAKCFLSEIVSFGKRDGYLLTTVDISDLKEAKQALREEKERLSTTLNSIGDGVVAVDTTGIITFMNPVAEKLTGYSFKNAAGRRIEDVIQVLHWYTDYGQSNPDKEASRVNTISSTPSQLQIASLTGHKFTVKINSSPIKEDTGKTTGFIMVIHDISETRAMATKIDHISNHDSLTGLPNKVFLKKIVDDEINEFNPSEEHISLLAVDIDHFKYVNDSLGHEKGDQIIKQLADRITTLVDSHGIVARSGGDEFLAYLRAPDRSEITDICDAIVSTAQEAFTLDNGVYNATASVGVSFYSNDARNFDELLRHADAAMFRAKQEGRNRYRVFSAELEQEIRSRQYVEKCLRDALDRKEMLVFYQPKVDTNTLEIVGVEALARLQAPDGRFVSPGEFIPLAEENGLISRLGEQVLNQACRDASSWLNLGHEIPVAVNVGASQFSETSLEDMIRNALTEHQLPAHLLELEMTESALMLSVALTQQRIEALSDMGVSVTIDDFGTGYSSLAYLKRFQVSAMKIDMSFVRDMLNSELDTEIVKMIIGLGESLKLKLVAEGVETEDQHITLKNMGCHQCQGYHFFKPMPYLEFYDLLKNYSATTSFGDRTSGETQ